MSTFNSLHKMLELVYSNNTTKELLYL